MLDLNMPGEIDKELGKVYANLVPAPEGIDATEQFNQKCTGMCVILGNKYIHLLECEDEEYLN